MKVLDFGKFKRSWLIFVFICLLLPLDGFSSTISPLKVLCLYKSNEGSTEQNNPALNYLAKPLLELGYKIEYRDAVKELPSDEEMKKYCAVVTFYFDAVYPEPERYINWLKEQVHNGKKVIIFGNFGAQTKDNANWVSKEKLNDFFFPFGLSFETTKKVNTEDIKISSCDKKIFKFSPPMPQYYAQFNSISSENKFYLTVFLKDMPEHPSCAAVRTPRGGMVQGGYMYVQNPSTGKLDWCINLKAFIEDVLSYKSAAVKYRKILGLYKSSEKQTAENNLIRKFAAEVLFKMGYEIDYLDIESGLPGEAMLKNYSAVITWFTGPQMKEAAYYCQWLADQVYKGKKVIILGNFGAYSEKISKGNVEADRFLSDAEINNFFYPFGLKMNFLWTSDSNLIKCDYANKDVIDDEFLKDSKKFTAYFEFESVSSQNKPLLTLSRTDVVDSSSDVVVRTPYGGMALGGYIYKQNPATWETKFILKLDKFLPMCLQKNEFIKPEIFNVSVDAEKELKEVASRHAPAEIKQNPVNLIPRKLLVLYKGSECNDFTDAPFYGYSGSILNFLGLTAEYVDIEKERPNDEKMKEYAGILAWFYNDAMKNAHEYNAWLSRQISRKKRIIIMGSPGAVYDIDTFTYDPLVRENFVKLGLDFDDKYYGIKNKLLVLQNELLTSRRYGLYEVNAIDVEVGRADSFNYFSLPFRILKEDKRFFNFESQLSFDNASYVPMVYSVDKKNINLLELYSRDYGVITPAVIGSWGGCLLGNYFFKVDTTYKAGRSYDDLIKSNIIVSPRAKWAKGKWVINPFLFLKETLDLKNLPVPDYTTLNGQRIFYSHIDGDGFTEASKINPSKLSGEILLEEIFKKYNLPISASVIVQDMVNYEKKYYNKPLSVAQKIFSLDSIEISDHSYSHPFDLQRGDLELKKANGASFEFYFNKPSPKKEILYSSALINQNISPPGKKNRNIFWPGKCNPTKEFIEEADSLNLRNINGGDPIYDEKYPSYSNLCPVLDSYDGRIQVHTSSSNDYIYTNYWTGNYGALKNVIEHFKHTDVPLRISPINVYYHYFSGIYPESLEALKEVYGFCLKQPIAPIFSSQYCDIVNDFYHTKLGRTDDGGFIVFNNGYLRTIRFDDAKLFPDFEKSANIIGFSNYNNSLYIFLDENKEHKIYLTDKAPQKTYLTSASHYVYGWNSDLNSTKFIIEGMGHGFIEIKNLKPKSMYVVRIGDSVFREARTDSFGTLLFDYELKGKPGKYDVEVRLQQ